MGPRMYLTGLPSALLKALHTSLGVRYWKASGTLKIQLVICAISNLIWLQLGVFFGVAYRFPPQILGPSRKILSTAGPTSCSASSQGSF